MIRLLGRVSVIGLILTLWQSETVVANHITDELMSKQAGQYLAYSSGSSADLLISNHLQFDGTHNEYVIVRHPDDEIGVGHAPDGDKLHELKTLVYNADAIVLGTPTRRVSALTDSHQFAFSDYEVKVNKVYLDKRPSLLVGQQIVVTRPGGVTVLAGQTVRAIEPEFQLFHLNEQYIFFLHFDDSTGAFALNPADAYLITNGQVVSGKTHSKVIQSPVSTENFLQDLNTAIASDTRGPQTKGAD